MYEAKLRLRIVDLLLPHGTFFVWIYKNPQGSCYSVLEFNIEPTLFIFKAKLDTQDKKKNEQVTEWFSLPAEHFATHKILSEPYTQGVIYK